MLTSWRKPMPRKDGHRRWYRKISIKTCAIYPASTKRWRKKSNARACTCTTVSSWYFRSWNSSFRIKSTRKNISENRARKKAEELTALAQEAYPAIAENSVHCQKTSYYAERLQDLLLKRRHSKTDDSNGVGTTGTRFIPHNPRNR